MEIPSELIKIAKLDERPKPIAVKAENPTINIQQPNPPPFICMHPVEHFMESLALPP